MSLSLCLSQLHRHHGKVLFLLVLRVQSALLCLTSSFLCHHSYVFYFFFSLKEVVASTSFKTYWQSIRHHVHLCGASQGWFSLASCSDAALGPVSSSALRLALLRPAPGSWQRVQSWGSWSESSLCFQRERRWQISFLRLLFWWSSSSASLLPNGYGRLFTVSPVYTVIRTSVAFHGLSSQS